MSSALLMGCRLNVHECEASMRAICVNARLGVTAAETEEEFNFLHFQASRVHNHVGESMTVCQRAEEKKLA
jgi:hypothetical protein